jgi:methylmalonyl-CoA mutase C-terminal domain/subunit
MVLFPRVVQLLAEKGAGDIPIFGGGIIPAEDVAPLKAAGIAEIFTPGTNTAEIIAWLHHTVDRPSQP